MVGKLGANNNSGGLLFPKRTPSPAPSSLTKAVMTSSKADAKALTTEFSFCRGKRLLLYKVAHLQKEAGDDAQESVVKDEDENEGVCEGGKSFDGEGTGEFPFSTEKQHVANNGVEIHENILDHDVNVGALSLDQELIVDSGKDRTEDLDLKNEDLDLKHRHRRNVTSHHSVSHL